MRETDRQKQREGGEKERQTRQAGRQRDRHTRRQTILRETGGGGGKQREKKLNSKTTTCVNENMNMTLEVGTLSGLYR